MPVNLTTIYVSRLNYNIFFLNSYLSHFQFIMQLHLMQLFIFFIFANTIMYYYVIRFTPCTAPREFILTLVWTFWKDTVLCRKTRGKTQCPEQASPRATYKVSYLEVAMNWCYVYTPLLMRMLCHGTSF